MTTCSGMAGTTADGGKRNGISFTNCSSEATGTKTNVDGVFEVDWLLFGVSCAPLIIEVLRSSLPGCFYMPDQSEIINIT